MRFVYMRNGNPLFSGTPDRELVFPRITTICIDYKMGRSEVPPADVNMQLRCYLTMLPDDDSDVSESPFRPSSLLSFKLCPGRLALEQDMAAKGLSQGEPSEDAAEGQRLHKAISEPLAPRTDLTPEQLETVERAERMEKEFIEFVLGAEPKVAFYAAIIQPRVSGKPSAVFYTDADIGQAKAEIDGIWDNAHQEGAPRNASHDACKFCPCKPLCPEYQEWIMALEKLKAFPAATWSPEQWDLFLSRRSELQKFLEDRYKEAKAIVSYNPDAIPGWELKDGAEVRHVSDLPAAWNTLSEILTARQFSDGCKISLGELEETLWKAKRNTPSQITQKEAKEIINARLGKLISLKKNASSLVKKKEKDYAP